MAKLDIGCGGRGTFRPGFIGTDILPVPTSPVRQDVEYVQLDFVNDELPWEAGSFDEIIAFHVIEHVLHAQARVLIQRALWLLKPGCEFYITTPDLKLLCNRYVANDTAFFSWKYDRPGHEDAWPGHAIGDKLNWILHEYGHKWMYDDVSLLSLILEAGGQEARPIPKDSPYYPKRGHDFGYVLTATGKEKADITPGSVLAEQRMATWAERERKGLKNR